MTPFSRAESLGYRVNQVARLFARALERRLAPLGIALGQFGPLLILWEEEGLTQSEIARRLEIEQPTIANTLRRMERDGLVTVSPDPDSRRQVRVHLTDHGRALRAQALAAAQEVNALAASAALDLLAALSCVEAALRADAASPAG